MASEPNCDSETPLTIGEFEEMVATEFDAELLRELLEEPEGEMEMCAEPTQPCIDVNGCDKGHNELYAFDWSEISPKEPNDANMCSVEDYCDEFIELGNSGEYSHSYEEASQEETAYVRLW